MAKYCTECGNKTNLKMIGYLLPFRVCVACGYFSGIFSYPYRFFLAPVESLFGRGEINLMSYTSSMSYFKACRVYLFGGKNE